MGTSQNGRKVRLRKVRLGGKSDRSNVRLGGKDWEESQAGEKSDW